MKTKFLVYVLVSVFLGCSNEGLTPVAPRGSGKLSGSIRPGSINSTTTCSVSGAATIGCGSQSQNYVYSISGAPLGTVTWSLANVVPAGSVSLMVVSPTIARVTFSSNFVSCTINASGGQGYICQAYQNVTSTCSGGNSGPCSISMYPGFVSPTNSINNGGTTVNGYLAFYSSTMDMVATYSDGFPHDYSVGTIKGGCVPQYDKSFTFSDGAGRNWTVYITGGLGIITLKLMPGSPKVPMGQVVNFNFSYSLP